MGAEVKYQSTSYRDLVRLIAKSSKYHIYEVEDIMNHFIAHAQVMLKNGEEVKISGLGTLKAHEMKEVSKVLNGTAIKYKAKRLSFKMDLPLHRYLNKE